MSFGRCLLLASLVLGLGMKVVQAADADRYSAEYQTCDQSPTVQLVECVLKLTKAWDVRLNRSYQALLQKLEAPQKQALVDAQQQWVRYRDANCRYYAAGQGSIRLIHVAECQRSMTAQRTCELEQEAAGLESSGSPPGCP